MGSALLRYVYVCVYLCVCVGLRGCVSVGLSLMRLVTSMWVSKISAARDLIEHDLSLYINIYPC